MERHREIIKILPDAKNAVLFIHGIVGTPDHFRDFIPMVPNTWSVCNLLLKGHGKGVRDFANASMKEWRNQVDQALDMLREQHENIIIVAHSMGTLFAIRSTVKDPHNIRHLFLMETPLRMHLRPAALSTSIKVLFNRISPSDVKMVSARNAYGINPDKRLWKYISWLPRYIELFRESFKTQKDIPLLDTPCTVYQSLKDEVVSNASLRYLKKSNIKIHILQESGHFHLAENDKTLVLKHLQSLCNRFET